MLGGRRKLYHLWGIALFLEKKILKVARGDVYQYNPSCVAGLRPATQEGLPSEGRGLPIPACGPATGVMRPCWRTGRRGCRQRGGVYQFRPAAGQTLPLPQPLLPLLPRLPITPAPPLFPSRFLDLQPSSSCSVPSHPFALLPARVCVCVVWCAVWCVCGVCVSCVFCMCVRRALLPLLPL